MVGAFDDFADGRTMLALLTARASTHRPSRTTPRCRPAPPSLPSCAPGEDQIIAPRVTNAVARVPDAATGVRLAQLELPLDTVRAFLFERCGASTI